MIKCIECEYATSLCFNQDLIWCCQLNKAMPKDAERKECPFFKDKKEVIKK